MNDDDLIAAYYACDDAALRQLQNRHQAALVAFLVNGGAGGDAEDCAQEVWIRVYYTKTPPEGRSPQRFDPAAGAFPAWLFRFARNILVDYLRRHRRRPSQLSAAEGEETPLEYQIPSSDDPVDTGLLTQELQDAIEDCVHELPEMERIVFDLERQRGQGTPPPNQRSWAEDNGYTYRAYTTALNRARQQLRECLALRMGDAE